MSECATPAPSKYVKTMGRGLEISDDSSLYVAMQETHVERGLIGERSHDYQIKISDRGKPIRVP
jgi:hypothetical protein